MIDSVSRRAFLGSGLCLAGAAASAALPRPESRPVPPVDLAGETPSRFARWRADASIRPVLPDDNEKRAVARAYDQSFSRVYVRDDGRLAMLVIAHGDTETGMLAIHRPATCYTAQGFTVSPGASVALPAPYHALRPERLFAARGERQEPILTWMTIADRQSGFGLAQNLATLSATWRGVPAEGFLVRASTLGADSASNYALLGQFLADLLAASSPDLRRRLGG